ncbi:MAG TPA: ABC transporter ATP-binding protein [Candidatus Limnocylindrales bacterium]|nr:ABC transporter ATP-binding protein [Candidatus Limnocylindrales bacterium]
MNTTSSAIRTENLTKRFRRVEALNGLNLDVPEGAIYALVGPNGAGKTTAIKILMNIFRATSGSAEVLGTPSAKVAGRFFTRVGYISENQELPLWMTVESFLAYLRPFYPTWDRDLENDLVRSFELPLDRTLRALSRGMRMKAALAGSLAYRPPLVVMDEPFGGLDPLVRDQLIEGMLELAAQSTVFVSSHDLAEIETFASHVGYLDNGRLRFSEEMSSLTARFREVELTFDSPMPLPPALPATWMQVNSSANVIRFVETRFDPDRAPAQIRETFSSVRDVAFTPMSLRAIFLAMARTKPAKVEEKS